MSINIIRLMKKKEKFPISWKSKIYHFTMVLSFTQLYNSYAEMSTFANTDFLTNTRAMFYTRVGSNLYINFYYCFIQTQQALG